MVVYYNKKDMVSFGNFLLSQERTKSVTDHPDLPEEILQDRLASVSHADFTNWKSKQGK